MLRLFLKLVLVLFLCINFVSINAQDNDLLRVELEARKNADTYHIVPVAENGVMVFYETDETDHHGNKLWVFTKYTTTFKEAWTKEYAVQKSMNYLNYFYSGKSNIYFLLENGRGYQVMNLDIKTGELFSKFVNSIGNNSTDIFKVIDNNVFVVGQSEPNFIQSCGQSCFTITCIPYFTGATVYQENAMVQNIGLLSGKNQPVFFNPKGKSSVLGAEVQADKFLNVLVRKIPHRKISQIHKYQYNAEGNVVSTSELKTEPDKEIMTGRIMNLNNATEIIIGTYAKVDAGRRKRLNQGAANGIYFCKFINNQQQVIKYFDFSRFASISNDFKNNSRGFWNRNHVVEGALGYKLLVHNIIESNNQYIMVAEAYYPQYHTETYTTYSNGRPMVTTRQVFDGYRYTNAIIAGFDMNGEMIWDNNFEMNDVLTFQLKERVKLLISEGEIAMIYSWDGKIKTKIINGNEVVEAKTETELDTKNKTDEVRNNFGSDVAYWYGNYFISYGYQTIKNTAETFFSGKKKRTVFYFNKIGYQ